MAQRPTPGEQREQLSAQRRKVDFDTYDVTVDELLRRVSRKRIDVAPVYQRQFRWEAERQSRLIESVLLGIPVPPLFMATNVTDDVQNNWEVVDGLQRLLSLVNFAGDTDTRKAVSLSDDPLALKNLEKLTHFEGADFAALPDDIKSAFEDRPLKVVVLNDKSELQVRYDLFERLNTGGIELSDQEIRECVYRGDFIDLLGILSGSSDFKTIVVLPDRRWKDGTPEEFVLRFFAYHDRYTVFDHLVKEFLNNFVDHAFHHPRLDKRSKLFTDTFSYLAKCFPRGIRTRKGATPVVLYEAITVGAALALSKQPHLEPVVDPTWVSSERLRWLTTGATNSKPRVKERIEYCRDRFLEHDA